MLAFSLGPSLTHADRECTLIPVRSEFADAYLVIRMGSPGPRGGMSKVRRDGYFLQEVEFGTGEVPDGWREFLLAHDHSERPDVYLVVVPPPGVRGSCSCDGFRSTGGCKHIDTLYYLVRVIGWDRADDRSSGYVRGWVPSDSGVAGLSRWE